VSSFSCRGLPRAFLPQQRYNTSQRPRDAIGSLSSRRSFVWFCMQDYVVRSFICGNCHSHDHDFFARSPAGIEQAQSEFLDKSDRVGCSKRSVIDHRARDGAMLQDCMGLWDAATHMSKQEWKAACMRFMVVEFPYGSRQPSPAVEPRSHQLGAVFGRRILLTRSHEADRVPRGRIDHSNSAVMNTTNPGDQPTGDEEYVGGTAGSAPNCVHHPLLLRSVYFFPAYCLGVAVTRADRPPSRDDRRRSASRCRE
jgi:hypothetical protein